MNSQEHLVVIGAGPKGLAIAAKNKVLRELGFRTPEITLVEKNEIASHWGGKNGYTNGKMKLGTGPEKDIGFPYNTQSFDSVTNLKVNQEMMKFSWMSYLMEQGQFSDYIDRGRPTPCHLKFADYLRWVAKKLEGHVNFVFGEMVGLDLINDHLLKISYQREQKRSSLNAHGLMITGPGLVNLEYNNQNSTRILDVENFWKNYKSLGIPANAKIGIVGVGENSASIALALGELNIPLDIQVISPSGFIFSRGESIFENQVYSDPNKAQWDRLSDKDKINFIRRTDLGVFGQYAQTQLNGRDDVKIVPGRVINAKEIDQRVVALSEYGDQLEELEFDYLILATGFDQLKMLKSVSSVRLLKHIQEKLGVHQIHQSLLEKRVGKDMSIEGLGFKLHLPMISRMRQGPGFANLSSLGRLSDRVLTDYIRESQLNFSTDKIFLQEAVC